MADDAQIRAAIQQFVDRAFVALDQVDYYRVLGVSSAASFEEIKISYYRLAARLHPDVHGDQIDSAFHARLTAVYSRVVEAYKVLSDKNRRGQYDNALARGDMRLKAGAKVRPKSVEDSIKNPKARQFYKLAQTALNDGDVTSARMNLQFALAMEPENELIQQLLEKAKGAGGG